MQTVNVRQALALALTTTAGAASIYLTTRPNPTQPQQDLAKIANQIVLMGSKSVFKKTNKKSDASHRGP